MITFSGHYYAPRSSRPSEGMIQVSDGQIWVKTADIETPQSLVLRDLQGKDNLYFEDGSYFHSSNPVPQEFCKLFQSQTARTISWLEDWTWWKAGIYGLALVVFILAARFALIVGLDAITTYFPAKWEHFLGQQSYLLMKKASLNETKLPKEQRQRIHDKVRLIARHANLPDDIEIYFHSSSAIGPNALAFPGGPVVITDQLIELMKNDEQVLAIIAHEFGHVEKRHSLRQIIKIMGVTGLASFVFGGNETFLEEILAVGIDAWALSNSRDHEKEADLVALDLLRKSNIDPEHMLQGMKALLASLCSSKTARNIEKCIEADTTGWMDTHPGSKERIDYLTKAIRP